MTSFVDIIFSNGFYVSTVMHQDITWYIGSYLEEKEARKAIDRFYMHHSLGLECKYCEELKEYDLTRPYGLPPPLNRHMQSPRAKLHEGCHPSHRIPRPELPGSVPPSFWASLP